MAVRWRPPSALGMWRILRFVGLVIAFFKYLIARGPGSLASHRELIDAEKLVPGTDS